MRTNSARHFSNGIVVVSGRPSRRSTWPSVDRGDCQRRGALALTGLYLISKTILPGAIDTPMLWENPNIRSGAETIDPSDVGQAEDIAAAVAFLASDAARFITGEALRVDGGRLARL